MSRMGEIAVAFLLCFELKTDKTLLRNIADWRTISLFFGSRTTFILIPFHFGAHSCSSKYQRKYLFALLSFNFPLCKSFYYSLWTTFLFLHVYLHSTIPTCLTALFVFTHNIAPSPVQHWPELQRCCLHCQTVENQLEKCVFATQKSRAVAQFSYFLVFALHRIHHTRHFAATMHNNVRANGLLIVFSFFLSISLHANFE